jgi:hypothetical protein
MCTGIVASCTVTYRPLIDKLFKRCTKGQAGGFHSGQADMIRVRPKQDVVLESFDIGNRFQSAEDRAERSSALRDGTGLHVPDDMQSTQGSGGGRHALFSFISHV